MMSSRRLFLLSTLGLFACSSPSFHSDDSAKENDSKASDSSSKVSENKVGPKIGDITEDDVEISSVLEISENEIGQRSFMISGDGHSHEVLLTDKAWSMLDEFLSVTVRSGPATSDAHAHWIRVTFAV